MPWVELHVEVVEYEFHGTCFLLVGEVLVEETFEVLLIEVAVIVLITEFEENYDKAVDVPLTLSSRLYSRKRLIEYYSSL
jgi:hypothetical protein